jgi:hypothetical protein
MMSVTVHWPRAGSLAADSTVTVTATVTAAVTTVTPTGSGRDSARMMLVPARRVCPGLDPADTSPSHGLTR